MILPGEHLFEKRYSPGPPLQKLSDREKRIGEPLPH